MKNIPPIGSVECWADSVMFAPRRKRYVKTADTIRTRPSCVLHHPSERRSLSAYGSDDDGVSRLCCKQLLRRPQLRRDPLVVGVDHELIERFLVVVEAVAPVVGAHDLPR